MMTVSYAEDVTFICKFVLVDSRFMSLNKNVYCPVNQNQQAKGDDVGETRDIPSKSLI